MANAHWTGIYHIQQKLLSWWTDVLLAFLDNTPAIARAFYIVACLLRYTSVNPVDVRTKHYDPCNIASDLSCTLYELQQQNALCQIRLYNKQHKIERRLYWI